MPEVHLKTRRCEYEFTITQKYNLLIGDSGTGKTELVNIVETYVIPLIPYTAGERREKRHRLFFTVGISTACRAIVIAFIILGTTVKSSIGNSQDEERTAQVLAQMQSAIDGNEESLGAESDYYNYADMLDRARASFPDEDVYYKLMTTEDYVVLVITTEKKANA